MEIVGVTIGTILLLVGFGLLVGIIFGFFGMGSFLLTPALLVMGYDSRVAVGSGLAFVFGTAVIGTLRHRDFGHVAYRLGVVLILGTVLGIEVGKRGVLVLETAGLARFVVGTTYVVLLASIGVFVLAESHPRLSVPSLSDGRTETDHRGVLGERVGPILEWLWNSPPRIDIPGGGRVSIWVVLPVAILVGILSGVLGIGGGFLRLPALTYLFGLPLPVAVGTNIFSVMIAGGFGSFTWAQVGGVDLSIVAPLLVGSALGARIGSVSTRLLDEEGMKVYFGALLLSGSLAVALRQLADVLDVEVLRLLSLVVLLTAASVVSGAVLYSGIIAYRSGGATTPPSAD